MQIVASPISLRDVNKQTSHHSERGEDDDNTPGKSK